MEQKPPAIRSAFMCPECSYEFSRWKALRVRSGVRFNCPVCNTPLLPAAREVEYSGAVYGTVHGFIMGLLGYLHAKYHIEWDMTVVMLALLSLAGLYLSTFYFRRKIHFHRVE